MRHRTFRMLAFPMALALVACATRPEAPDEEVTPQMAAESAELQTYRIRNWSAPDNRTLIVESVDGRRYEARFMTDCLGLRLTETIGFVTRGTSQLDQFSGIVLPDGTRCTFRSFTQISTPADD